MKLSRSAKSFTRDVNFNNEIGSIEIDQLRVERDIYKQKLE